MIGGSAINCVKNEQGIVGIAEREFGENTGTAIKTVT